jgi:hypothetical protein
MTTTEQMQKKFEHMLSAWHNLTNVANTDDAIAEVALFMWQAAIAHSESTHAAEVQKLEPLEKKLAEQQAGITEIASAFGIGSDAQSISTLVINAKNASRREGWVMVPSTPSMEQCVAGASEMYKHAWESDTAEARDIYKAMIAAVKKG